MQHERVIDELNESPSKMQKKVKLSKWKLLIPLDLSIQSQKQYYERLHKQSEQILQTHKQTQQS